MYCDVLGLLEKNWAKKDIERRILDSSYNFKKSSENETQQFCNVNRPSIVCRVCGLIMGVECMA